MREPKNPREFDRVGRPPEMTRVEAEPKRSLSRLLIVKLFLFLFFIGVAARLFEIQIVDAVSYKEHAQRQYEAKVDLVATRGSIFDRNGNVLVSNSMFVSFAADPKLVSEGASSVAKAFSNAFGRPYEHYLSRLSSNKRFVWLERQVRPENADILRNLNTAGVLKLAEPKRLYHYDELAGQLIGLTNVDNSGIGGLELQFDRYLRGTNGYMIMQRDGLGGTKPSADHVRVDPINGHHLHLTIDLVFQAIAEEMLKRGIERNKAESGLVIMLSPGTGEILALAQYPGINLNKPTPGALKHQKLRAFTDMLEPGSVFKIVTAAAALEHNIVDRSQRFYAEHGEYRVPLPGGRFRTIRDTREREYLTFQEAMEVSSNIVMAKVSDLLGAERLYKMARDFGFGIETGVEYPGERKGELKHPVHWSGTTLNTMAYGYEVGVTPIQLAVAYAAIANGGVMMKPTLLKKITTESGATVIEQRPQTIRRVVSPQTARILTEFFEGVVERGTATPARLENVGIAGKTGTARKVVEGRYQSESHTVTFAGFFPKEAPEIVCLVMLDNPRIGVYSGGLSAAPIFRDIAQRIVATGRLPMPRSTQIVMRHTPADEVATPDVSHLRYEVAQKVLEARGLRNEVFGSGIVLRQSPLPGTLLPAGSTVTLLLSGEATRTVDGDVLVPDVRGLSVRRAMIRLAMEGLEADVRGSGSVARQVPAPDDHVGPGSRIVLFCEPQPL